MSLSQHIRKSDMRDQNIFVNHAWVSNGHWLLTTTGDKRFMFLDSKGIDIVHNNFPTATAMKLLTDRQVLQVMPKVPLGQMLEYKVTDLMMQDCGLVGCQLGKGIIPGIICRVFLNQDKHFKLMVQERYWQLAGCPHLVYQKENGNPIYVPIDEENSERGIVAGVLMQVNLTLPDLANEMVHKASPV